MTSKLRAKAKPGAKKVVAAKVAGRSSLSKVQRMKKLRFTGKVRSGSTTAKFNKRLKLKHA